MRAAAPDWAVAPSFPNQVRDGAAKCFTKVSDFDHADREERGTVIVEFARSNRAHHHGRQ
jgi:hypothetical protein